MHQAELYVQDNHSDDTRIPTVHETRGRSEKNDDKTWECVPQDDLQEPLLTWSARWR